MGEPKLTYRVTGTRELPAEQAELVIVEWTLEPEEGEAFVVLNDQIRMPAGSSNEAIIGEIEYRGRTFVRPRYIVAGLQSPSKERRELLGVRRQFEGGSE